MAAKKRTGAIPIEVARRNKAIIEMRRKGYTLQQAGDAVGLTKMRACQIVKKYLAEVHRENVEMVQEMVALEIARYDRVLVGIWDEVKTGNLQAIDRFLRLSEARRSLLGLDAPKKIAPTDPSGKNEFDSVRKVLVVQPQELTQEQWLQLYLNGEAIAPASDQGSTYEHDEHQS